MLNRRSLLSPLALAAVALTAAPAFAADDVVVFAAASLKNALDDVDRRATTTKTGKTVTVSYAASSALAKQIEQAAPADIFFSADLAWMEYLAEREPDRRRHAQKSLLGNEIVLVVPKDSTATTTIAAGFDLAALLGADGRLAMANVEFGSRRQVRQGGAGEARRVGQGRRSRRAGRQRPRRARLRRDAARRRPASSTPPTPPPSRASRSSAPSPPTATRRSSIRWR